MPKAARRTSGPKAAPSNRKEPYSKSPKSAQNTNKENVDPNSNSKSKPDKGDYRDIPLEVIAGEIPCHDNAATIRRKLNKLITDKVPIPGTDKKFNKSSMAQEMLELEKRGDEVEHRHPQAAGPTTASLGKFLKKSGQMGGGDSPCYYWGNVMLEKMRIWKGEKKSKAEVEAEKRFPAGHKRWDPTKESFISGPGLPPPSVAELNNVGRLEE